MPGKCSTTKLYSQPWESLETIDDLVDTTGFLQHQVLLLFCSKENKTFPALYLCLRILRKLVWQMISEGHDGISYSGWWRSHWLLGAAILSARPSAEPKFWQGSSKLGLPPAAVKRGVQPRLPGASAVLTPPGHAVEAAHVFSSWSHWNSAQSYLAQNRSAHVRTGLGCPAVPSHVHLRGEIPRGQPQSKRSKYQPESSRGKNLI